MRNELAPADARVIALGAGTFGPEEAKRRGVIDEIVDESAVLSRALQVAKERAAMPRATYAAVKKSLRSESLARMAAVLEADTDPLFVGAFDLGRAARVLKA